jgi:hypothetical protein
MQVIAAEALEVEVKSFVCETKQVQGRCYVILFKRCVQERFPIEG